MSYIRENWGWLLAGYVLLSFVTAMAAGAYLDSRSGKDDDD